MNSREPAQALHGRESACPVCASSIIQPGKSHSRELAGPEDGRIYYVSNVPVTDKDGTTAKASIMYDITECRRLKENLRGDKRLSEGVINSLTGIFFF